MSTPHEATATLEVFTDGACELCRRSRAWVELRDKNNQLCFIDFRTANPKELPFSDDALATEMWVRELNGTFLSGYSAWLRVLAELPGWRAVAALGALPPLSWMGPPAYRCVARYRDRLPLPRHCDENSCRQSRSR